MTSFGPSTAIAETALSVVLHAAAPPAVVTLSREGREHAVITPMELPFFRLRVGRDSRLGASAATLQSLLQLCLTKKVISLSTITTIMLCNIFYSDSHV